MHGVTDMGLQDSMVLDCVRTDKVTRKRGRGAAAGACKRARQNVVKLLDVLPEELVEVILLDAVGGHLDIVKILLCCKLFHTLLKPKDEVWKKISLRSFGCRDDIISPALKRIASMESWENFYKRHLLQCRDSRAFLKHQHLLSVSIRSILINWMLAVCDEAEEKGVLLFGRMQAQHRCVAYFDRFCCVEKRVIQTCELQKLGASCIVLALQKKDPKDIPLAFYDFVSYFSDGAVDVDALIRSTKYVYNMLSAGGEGRACFLGNAMPSLNAERLPFNIAGCEDFHPMNTEDAVFKCAKMWPACCIFKISRDDDDGALTTALRILQHMKKDNEQSCTFHLTNFLLELSLQSQIFLKYEPSVIGAACFAFACHTLSWNFTFWKGPFLQVVKEQNIDSPLIFCCIEDVYRLFRKSQYMIVKCQDVQLNGKKKQIPHMIVKYCKDQQQKVASLLPASTLPPKWWTFA